MLSKSDFTVGIFFDIIGNSEWKYIKEYNRIEKKRIDLRIERRDHVADCLMKRQEVIT